MKIFNPIHKYSVDEIRNAGLVDLFLKFEEGFRSYEPLVLISRLTRIHPKEVATNFNMFDGHLEMACNAAQSIGKDYDLGMGIAKKGLWLSYVFNLHGLPTYDVLVERHKEQRKRIPLSPLTRKLVKDKNILIFDNDIVTGNTVNTVSKDMVEAGAKRTDLLLVYQNTRLNRSFYNQVSSSFQGKPKLIGEVDDRENEILVVNTECEIPKNISQYRSLEMDFSSGRQHLTKLAEILGVKI